MTHSCGSIFTTGICHTDSSHRNRSSMRKKPTKRWEVEEQSDEPTGQGGRGWKTYCIWCDTGWVWPTLLSETEEIHTSAAHQPPSPSPLRHHCIVTSLGSLDSATASVASTPNIISELPDMVDGQTIQTSTHRQRRHIPPNTLTYKTWSSEHERQYTDHVCAFGRLSVLMSTR